jgi:hypothetical protein
MEVFGEDLRDWFYDNGDTDVQVEVDEDEVNVYLDLPSTDNYDAHIIAIESFFRDSDFDVEDYEIDGDYEGQITISYIGE